MKIPPMKIVFSEQDREEVLQRINKCLVSGQMAQGENVKEFEERFAAYCGTRFAVAVSNGSCAIEAVMRIKDVKDKEVLVPTNTFFATAAAVGLAGGRVELVDTDPATFSVNLKTLKQHVGPNTAGVIVVHIGGIITPEIKEIKEWCDSKGLWLFEDCAHAHGSELYGKRAGTFGIAGSYSFFATKVMTSSEGGMVITDDEALAKKVMLMRNHGKPEPWVSYHTEFGGNWRMSELAGAVGLVQLKRLDDYIASREKIARVYSEGLKKIPALTTVVPQGRSSWYKYIVLLPKGVDRDKFKAAAKERGVSLPGGVYELPLHRQPVFEGKITGAFAAADDVCARHICLPLYYGMTEEEARYVLDTIKSLL